MMDDEMESIWNETVVAYRGTILAFAWSDQGKTPKTSFRIAGISAQIRTEHLPIPKSYPQTKLFNSLTLVLCFLFVDVNPVTLEAKLIITQGYKCSPTPDKVTPWE
jgi:hypothetical protein